MEQKFKFRAWQDYSVTGRNMTGGRMIAWNDTDMGFILNRLYSGGEQYVFQQSTGILDKDSVEIYDGDIIQVFISGKLYNFPVQRAESGLYYLYKFRHVLVSLLSHPERKVMGNIFENPELLTVAQTNYSDNPQN